MFQVSLPRTYTHHCHVYQVYTVYISQSFAWWWAMSLQSSRRVARCTIRASLRLPLWPTYLGPRYRVSAASINSNKRTTLRFSCTASTSSSSPSSTSTTPFDAAASLVESLSSSSSCFQALASRQGNQFASPHHHHPQRRRLRGLSRPFFRRSSQALSASSLSWTCPSPQQSRTIITTTTFNTNTTMAGPVTDTDGGGGAAPAAPAAATGSTGGNITARDKLLIHVPQPPPPGFLDALAARFPQLSVRWEIAGFDPLRSDLASADTLPPEVLDGVTMLCAYPPAAAAAIPDVRFVQLISAGSDRWVGHDKYRDPRVVFCSGSGCHAPQIAEWVIASWLASEHHFDVYKQQQLQRHWSARVADHPVTDSMGRRMAVFGYGAIGRHCAQLGRALGMDVVAYTRRPRPTPASRRLDPGSYAVPGTGDPDGVIPSRWFHGEDDPAAALADMLRLGVDLLVLAVPLSDSTRGLVGRREFDLMRDVAAGVAGVDSATTTAAAAAAATGSESTTGQKAMRRPPPFLCNIARGPIVDSLALVDALRDGSLRGAALDVTDPEPLPADHPLWTAPNVFITPHVAWQSTGIIDRIAGLILENLTRLDEGRPLLNQIKK
ncbi:hypothetical protein JDV02_009822 [Purpureocillium takamizusanense]|uniref:D-isomer specific 2-hydroxyacid dehydrogenase NAD-binding domain-containing protein n=1 Tax=Purpureocillium takamizusanense TaxID=2060973 RepID=A0A9Q8QPK9_9HYPO|nr:uncharacterized protein JDV02_009822 [Purpureocillium takamizusanense]UNI24043.1 hypothetical protein JDV02_009822 [Purpureocillium takamizusanense]